MASRTACGAAVAGFLLAAALGGCSGPQVHVAQPQVPALPAGFMERVPLAVSVAFPAAFATAQPETSFAFLGETYITRHAIGAAAETTLRAVLERAFVGGPGKENEPADPAALLVAGMPTMASEMLPDALVVNFRQSITFPFELRSPAGAALANWQVTGRVATGLYASWFTAQTNTDAAMLRNAAAALAASLGREPVLTALVAQGASAVARARGVPRVIAGRGVALLRLDAGLAHGDALEARVGKCLADVLPTPRGLPGANIPGALRDAMFPWFDPFVMPLDAPAIADLLGRATVQERLEALGVSHLVLLTVHEGERVTDDRMACAAGFNAGACVGYYEAKRGYAIEAAVWDAGVGRLLGASRAAVTRTFGALGALIPIPFTSSDEVESCTRLRDFVSRSLPAH
jgi:hypothetical protein